MKLLTEIKLNKQEHNQIGYNSKILLLGSCFSENIGEKFSYFKFQSLSNPFGILFHPKAIERLIVNAVKQANYTEKAVFFNNERWHCFDTHSILSNVSKTELLNNLNTGLKLTNQSISESTHIIITLGTAWVYNFIETNQIVANCHKVPQRCFNKNIVSVSKIVESLEGIAEAIQKINPKTQIIFTVSPVRHIKDGFTENTRSKAHLVAAIHQFISQNSSSTNLGFSYFPSYEIMLDELRDYRFYNADLLHPNATAIEYIWRKFQNVWMESKTVAIMEQVESIQKALTHRPFNKNSKAHQLFLENNKKKQEEIQLKFPHIIF